jgi:hypothetical protein
MDNVPAAEINIHKKKAGNNQPASLPGMKINRSEEIS